MSKAIIASAVLLASAGPAQSPTEPSGYGPGMEWFCGFVGDWKALMRRDYSGSDRSVPEVERRCHMASEADQ